MERGWLPAVPGQRGRQSLLMTDMDKTRLKKIFLIAVIVAPLALIAGFIVAPHYVYYLALEKSNKETRLMKCREGITEEFDGVIVGIEKYEYIDFMHGRYFALSISTGSGLNTFVSYQFTVESCRELLDFARLGHTVKKKRGEKTFMLASKTGEERTFVIPHCNIVEE